MRSMGSVRQASFRLMLRSRTEGILAEMVVRICRNGVLLHSAEDRLIRQQGIVLPSGKFQAANESGRLHRAKDTARLNAGRRARQDWPSAPTARHQLAGDRSTNRRPRQAGPTYAEKDR